MQQRVPTDSRRIFERLFEKAYLQILLPMYLVDLLQRI
jgi:hypothetical protein